MLRPSYLIFIVLFATWDLFRLVRTQGARDLVLSIRTSAVSIWPVVPVIALLLWFSLAQSGHQWNNANFASSTWFPLSNPKSLADAHFIQGLNWRHIEDEYGSFEGRDWYFTNNEVFGGAGDSLSAIRANMGFVAREMAGNVKPAMDTAANLVVLRNLPFYKYYSVLFLFAIVYGAARAAGDRSTIVFVIGSVVILAASVSVLPKIGRHYVPLVPVLVLSASWYAMQMRMVLTSGGPNLRRLLFWAGISGVALVTLYLILRAAVDPLPASKTVFTAAAGYTITLTSIMLGWYRPEDHRGRLHGVLGPTMGLWMAAVLVILFSNGTQWRSLVVGVVQDLRSGEVRVLQSNEVPSMKTSIGILEPLIRDCRGVMAHEHAFIGAFMDLPLERVYDMWEIPPFGSLGDPAYDGLRPDRIDCVLVSDSLVTSVGQGTNIQVRYQGYVEPYVRQLQDMGAETYDIPSYGRAIILSPSG